MTAEGQETATTPAIPAPRAPLDPPQSTTPDQPQAHDQAAVAPGAERGTPDLGRAGRRRVRLVLLAVVTAFAVLLLGLLRPDQKREAAAVAAPSAQAASSAPATPYDKAVRALADQAAALMRGDEAAWLAAVDPSRSALRTRYRNVFRSLRALGVTRYEYQPGIGQPVQDDPDAVEMRVDTAYCYAPEICPDNPATDWSKPPRITERLTMRLAGGRYVISDRRADAKAKAHEPVPWEDNQLVFAQGRRVVVAAPPDQAGYLSKVLKVAEAAAAVDDRYAALAGTRQTRYRIFLAGEKQWKTWYGGEDNKWVIGLAIPLNMYGIDVLLRSKELGDPLDLRVTLQHELGHVVTLAGAFRVDAAEDTWLSEGVAEYIGWQPRSATGSLRRASVRWQLNRSPAKSMVPVRPGANASNRAGDAFYGLSHFAVDCMAKRFGEPKLFTFVRLVLTKDNTYDQAARDAYGVSFATVDKYCVTWIRQQAL